MPEKRYQVFLSSTYRDLIGERDRMLRELARFNYIAAGMEYFPAVDEEQLEYIRSIIDDSDYYVIVIAGKYGSLAPDGISYCEKEYNYALEKGIPVIPLLHRGVASLPSIKREDDPTVDAKLEAFRKRLSERRLAAFWQDETELCLALVGSLVAATKRHPTPGWVRGSKESTEDLLRKIVSLEEENALLRANVDSPKIEHIRRLLNSEMTLSYYVEEQADSTSQPAPMETKVQWQKVADYLLPRIRRQTAEPRFQQIVIEFVQSLSTRNVKSVEIRTIDQIRRTLRTNGLIGDFITIRGETIFVMTNLGADYVRESLDRYEAEVRRNEGVTEAMEKATFKLFRRFDNWLSSKK